MRPGRVALAAVAVVWASAGCTATRRKPAALTFAAMGDGPRTPAEWRVLVRQLDAVARDGRSAFIVHVGDIWRGAPQLPESHYRRMADLLGASRVPVCIVPGDNEWNDTRDPNRAWTYWKRHLLGLEERFAGMPRVFRQAGRPENVAWVSSGVLMVGINLVGGRVHDAEEWRMRHRQDAEWVKENLGRFGDSVRAAVVFAQAAPSKRNTDFTGRLARAAAAWGRPLLYLHGDGHVFKVWRPWMVPNMTRVQVDRVGIAPPLLVTVTPDPNPTFRFDRRLGQTE